MDSTRTGRTVETEVVSLDGDARTRRHDNVVGEEPLELRIVANGQSQTLAVTMRTPGNDFELAAGFVYGEGIVRSRKEIVGLTYCLDPAVDPEQRYNIVSIELHSSVEARDLKRFERHFTMSSACGVCGRAQLESLRELGAKPIDDELELSPHELYSLPERMRVAQRVFASTGGLHAAGLFTATGDAAVVREDVGRHNAVDKLVGWALLNDRLPLRGSVLMVSGRASYEILQKAVMAGAPVVASVSAPSSLAVDLAREFNVTLAGFVRDCRANIYSAPVRITSGTNPTER